MVFAVTKDLSGDSVVFAVTTGMTNGNVVFPISQEMSECWQCGVCCDQRLE